MKSGSKQIVNQSRLKANN